jgi:hypothetical protein
MNRAFSIFLAAIISLIVYPRIVTPGNKDGINDFVIFYITDNLKGADYYGEIYSSDGKIINHLSSISDENGRTYLIWRCDTENLTPVPAGIYLYQIISNEEKPQIYCGSIIVAK